ncbi:LOB domain-containing protein 1-like [Cryptomeria japonica]|uniref:LOB domain-containing protein 1-like n=1 Tax=Cryptomeria japonica TaxID=3369 RepID=UPI0027DA7786|nr:LOB domain-containing protein 1-like [Cryptomeria japonica]
MVSCASCRVHRKKCSEECILAPYFPPDDLDNGTFETPGARVNDPVHGCTKDVHRLRKQIADLESQLAVKQVELKHMRSEYDNLLLVLGTASLDSQLFQYPTDAI